MRKKTLLSTMILLAFLAVLPSAKGNRNMENDPMVRLYEIRVTHAMAQKRRLTARLGYTKARYERIRQLLDRNAASAEEFDLIAAAYEANIAQIHEADALINEATTLLELCRTRVAEGKEMPIIPLSSSVAETLH